MGPDEEDDHFDEQFAEWLNLTGEVGTDGTGGTDSGPRTRRTFAGAAVTNIDRSKTAYMYCKVTGRQTVPRAELTALLKVLRCISVARTWLIYIDAKYVIDGIEAPTRAYRLKGRNGNLWTQIYKTVDELEDKGIGDIKLIKVKSHVTCQDDWDKYGMTLDKLLFNELADVAVLVGRRTFANHITIKEDGAAKYEVQKIARRLAAIEVSMWNDEPDFKKHIGKDFAHLKEQRAKEVKRKVVAAIITPSTSKGPATSTVIAPGWPASRTKSIGRSNVARGR